MGDMGNVCSMPSSLAMDIQKRWDVLNKPPMDSGLVDSQYHIGIFVKLMPMGVAWHHCGEGVSSEEELDRKGTQ